ncbi:unnamed protein product [Chrysoparadoxa australica]
MPFNKGDEVSLEQVTEADEEHLELIIAALQEENDALKEVIASTDADQVTKATKGMGTDEARLIGVLCSRTKAQMTRIDLIYHKRYGRSLLDVVSKDVKGKFGKLLKYALMPHDRLGAELFSKAVDGMGCNAEMLNDIVNVFTNDELAAIKRHWDAKNDSSILDRLRSELRGDHEDLMVHLFMGKRPESEETDAALAEEQAEAIYKAGVGKMFGTDEKAFIKLIAGTSRAQMALVKDAYEAAQGMSLKRAIKKEVSGKFRDALYSMLYTSREQYIAAALNKAFEGMGADGSRIALLLGATEKKEMAAVNNLYLKTYGATLEEILKDELHGDFEDAAIAWVSGAEPTGGMEYAIADLGPDADRRTLAKALMQERMNINDYLAQVDAMLVREACKGLGTDDTALIAIICGRSKAHLRAMDVYYHQLFERSLLQQIHSECSGHYKLLMEYALMTEEAFDTRMLREAMVGLGTDESLLIEILAPKTNARIAAARAKYEGKYDTAVVDKVNNELHGRVKQLALILLRGERSESEEVDEALAQEQATQLYDAGVGRVGTDEDVFMHVLGRQSRAQIEAIKAAYEREYNQSLMKAIKKETHGDFEDALVALLATPEDFYAMTLKKAFKGIGTADKTVARILGGNDKSMVTKINERYFERYDQTLEEALKSELSGRFRKAALTWVISADPKEAASRLVETLNDLPTSPTPPRESSPERSDDEVEEEDFDEPPPPAYTPTASAAPPAVPGQPVAAGGAPHVVYVQPSQVYYVNPYQKPHAYPTGYGGYQPPPAVAQPPPASAKLNIEDPGDVSSDSEGEGQSDMMKTLLKMKKSALKVGATNLNSKLSHQLPTYRQRILSYTVRLLPK